MHSYTTLQALYSQYDGPIPADELAQVRAMQLAERDQPQPVRTPAMIRRDRLGGARHDLRRALRELRRYRTLWGRDGVEGVYVDDVRQARGRYVRLKMEALSCGII